MTTIGEKFEEAFNSDHPLKSIEALYKESKLHGAQFWKGARDWIACFIVEKRKDGGEKKKLVALFNHCNNRYMAFQMPALNN